MPLFNSRKPITNSTRRVLGAEEGSVEDVFCWTFAVNIPGIEGKVELLPGGDDVAVTEDNRKKFVQLYIDFVLNFSVSSSFEAFRRWV